MAKTPLKVLKPAAPGREEKGMTRKDGFGTENPGKSWKNLRGQNLADQRMREGFGIPEGPSGLPKIDWKGRFHPELLWDRSQNRFPAQNSRKSSGNEHKAVPEEQRRIPQAGKNRDCSGKRSGLPAPATGKRHMELSGFIQRNSGSSQHPIPSFLQPQIPQLLKIPPFNPRKLQKFRCFPRFF